MIHGSVILAEALEVLNIDLIRLVARCSIWVNPDVFSRVAALNQNAEWYPNSRRERAGKVDEIKGKISECGGRDYCVYHNPAKNTAAHLHRQRFPHRHLVHVRPRACYHHLAAVHHCVVVA